MEENAISWQRHNPRRWLTPHFNQSWDISTADWNVDHSRLLCHQLAILAYKCLYLDMHGLIFETSIWLLAGSTRYLARMFKRGADRAWARPTFPRRKLSAAEMFFNSRGHQGRPDKQRPSRPSKDRRSDERVKPSHGERSLSRNKSSPRVRSFGVPAARSSRSQNQLLAVRRN